MAGAIDQRHLQGSKAVPCQTRTTRVREALVKRMRTGGRAGRAALLTPVPWRCSGTPVRKEEKPRSSVMPRLWLCGLLSNAAVDAVVLSARAVSNRRGGERQPGRRAWARGVARVVRPSHGPTSLPGQSPWRAIPRLVLPASTWPRIPTLTFKTSPAAIPPAVVVPCSSRSRQ